MTPPPVADAAGEVRRARVRVVAAALEAEFGEGAAADLEVIGGGLEAVVLRAKLPPFGPVAIKAPLQRFLSSGNEPRLDTSALVAQEARLAALARRAGVSCPEPFIVRRAGEGDAGADFLVSAFVAVDGTTAEPRDLGSLVRAIHDIPVETTELVAMEGHGHADTVVAHRLRDRLRRLRDRWPGIPSVDVAGAFSVSGPGPVPEVLLHMDARPANLLVVGGRIQGVVDWSNALVGPPALELARVAESGNLTGAFLDGYGTEAPFEAIEPVREILYRLDTAVMLAHVFLDHGAAVSVQERLSARVTYLCRALGLGRRPGDSFIFRPG